MERRRLLLGTGTAGVLALLSACSPRDGSPGARPGRPRALVYRGPASTPGCAEAVAALLRSGPQPCAVTYCGPAERVPLSARSLARADVYAQPGGGDDVEAAWASVRSAAPALRRWVKDGGRYLGFCMGAYLAGHDPGFGLLPGDTDAYAGMPGASVDDSGDTVVAVRWRGRARHMYFQDGPRFDLDAGAEATILATYGNGAPAALVTSCGSGSVGVVGPHPEADTSWYEDAGLRNPDGVRSDLGHDFVDTTLQHRR